ncbi:MAG: Zn-dependent protease with chaperone function [Paracoccaceae bacterium]|jgi:Zn-dependent protease with chaperone function
MNFFEHQEKARKQSRWLIFAFFGVALLIVLAVDLVVMFVFSTQMPSSINGGQLGFAATLDPEMWLANSGLLLTSSVATGGAIGLASLAKIASLRSGGGKVARDMGGTIVTPDTRDPLRRRLYNVVEEIALASGTPVPDVYVMENEPGINAFAAGYTPSDAAVAVTQGTLEKLSRAELQGVIAHEFSHIFNGDMRINIRMMGVIFGITVIAILGRKFLYASRYRVSSSRDNNGSAIVAIGIVLMIVGYIGLFFARWMKSALSRQREYLADASAVQFTRDPDGISGALKKIAAYSHSSYLTSDSEEVSHMLFSSGFRSRMFSTHPPLEQRIARIEKGFDAADIEVLAKKLTKQEKVEHLQAVKAAQEQHNKKHSKNKGGFFDIDGMFGDIGNPSNERIAAAAMLTASLASGLSSSAHSLEWAPEVLFYCLLDKDDEIRSKQLLIVVEQMGDISERKIQHLVQTHGLVKVEQRLAILEMSFPTLKRRPVSDIERIQLTIELLANADSKIDSFEFLLTRLIKQYLNEADLPNKTRLHGRKNIKDCMKELSVVMSILSAHGQHRSSAQGLQRAQKAFKEGMNIAGINHMNLSFSGQWQQDLDLAISVLDKLKPKDKSTVVAALVRTVLDDKQVLTDEHEMLRVICALIHVPIPLLGEG